MGGELALRQATGSHSPCHPNVRGPVVELLNKGAGGSSNQGSVTTGQHLESMATPAPESLDLGPLVGV